MGCMLFLFVGDFPISQYTRAGAGFEAIWCKRFGISARFSFKLRDEAWQTLRFFPWEGGNCCATST